MAQSRQRFIRPEVLTRLGSMELRARMVVEGFMTGLHRSPYRGLSIEFAEYRHYQPGDEPRRIDWKAYARSDRFYVRECEDETNLAAWIIIDASASMGFGSNGVTKWQYGGMLAASLAWLLQRQNDQVGLVVLDEAVRIELAPRGTRGHLIGLIGELERTAPSRKTRLAPILHMAAERMGRKGMVLVVSDLLDEVKPVLEGLQHLQFGGNDVVVFHTLDAAELRFDYDGPMLFVDPESGKVVPALAQEVKEHYLGAIGEFVREYSEEMGKSNIVYKLVDTSKPLDEALLAFVTSHSRRK